jgi:thioesterase domain-containing protein/acyl carrier protein
MMNLEQLLAELSQRGVKLWLDGDRLGIRAPKGVLTPELKDALSQNKADILVFLQKANAAANSQLPPLVTLPREGVLPLSLAQERLWSLEQLTPGTAVYNLSVALRLTGVLDRSVLTQSLAEILRRQEVLRTRFEVVEGQPIPVITSATNWILPVADLRDFPASQRQAQAQKLATELAQQPFDLTQDHLWRVKLIQLTDEDQVLVLTIHHIISDGWSFGVFLRELSALYTAFSQNQPSPLPELSIQYADFAHWQKQWLADDTIAPQLDYWKQQLSGDVSPLKLPAKPSPSGGVTYHGDRQSFQLSPDLTDALKSLSQRHGVTLFVTLLAAFKTLLYRYTTQEDILLCSPVAGRTRSETEGLVGYFNNVLPLRTNLSGNPKFIDLLDRIRQVANEAFERPDVPLQQIAELPNLARTPLSRGMFALQNAPSDALVLPGITVTDWEVHSGTANFDVSLSMEEKGNTITGVLFYKTDRFETETVAELLNNFQRLLASITENPQQQLSAIPLALQEVDRTADNLESKPTYLAPRDRIETQLVKIWEKVLNLQPIGIQDNFFELGGHSLLAVQLFAQIEKTYSKNLPLATLVSAPTIEKLAKVLNQEGESTTWSSLVPIQPNGSKIPLFCIHAVGGNVLTYVDLSRHLGLDQPVYGLQARGIDGKGEFHQTIKEMAAHYIPEILSFYPEGPYLLAGLSGGGVIAYEIAQQLISQGRQVNLVALFDTYNPTYQKIRQKADFQYHQETDGMIGTIWTKTKWLRKLRRSWRRVFQLLSYFLQLNLRDKIAFCLEKRENLKKNINATIEAIAYKLDPRKGRPLPYRLRENVVTENLRAAVKSYVSQVYPGKVTLFRATASIYHSLDGVLDSDELGWDEFAGGGLEVYKVPGNHSTLMTEPNVQVLAAQLKPCLDRAQENHAVSQDSELVSPPQNQPDRRRSTCLSS